LFTFSPALIFNEIEIEHQHSNFSLLEQVDEIWHVEKILYSQGGHIYFKLRNGGHLQATIAFHINVFVGHSKGGLLYPM
jgi:hypothetical protein